MTQTIEDKTLARIYGNGRAWAFSPKDFGDLGSRSAIDLALHRLTNKSTIRRVIRGICSANVRLSFVVREFLRCGLVSGPAHLRSELRVNSDSPG